MIVPAFLNLISILGMGVDIRDYGSTFFIYSDEHRLSERVSTEDLEFLVTEEPTEILDLAGVPRDLAFRTLAGVGPKLHFALQNFVYDLRGGKIEPALILAIKIETTSSILKLAPNKTHTRQWRRLAANATHYVKEVGRGDLVLALVQFHAPHPADRLRLTSLLRSHLNGTSGSVHSPHFSEVMSRLLQELPNTTDYGPVRTSVRVYAKTGSYGDDINNLVTLVPLLRNYTKNFINTLEGGVGSPIWYRLELMHSVDPTWPLLHRTMLSEYKNRLAKNLLVNYVDVAQAKKCVYDLNNIEEEDYLLYNYPYELYKNLSLLSINFSLYNTQPENDLKVLQFNAAFSTTKKVHRFFCHKLEMEKNGACVAQFEEEELSAVPREVLSEAPRPQAPADCKQRCLDDPSCRTAVVASLKNDEGPPRCWTLKTSLKYTEFLKDSEYLPGARTSIKKCFS